MREENEFKGDLIAEEGKVYEYTKITGKVIAHISATVCQFPKLESCGRSAYAASATVCQFPKLESCGGYAYADSATGCQFPKLESCPSISRGVLIYSCPKDTREI